MRSTNPPLLRVDADGLWCEAGGFHIDPWGAVPKALITHAHSDHARPGSTNYLCSSACEPVLRRQLGSEVAIDTLPYGASRQVGDVAVSFHPAGHILGSAQIRVERHGEIWVISGDYKLAPDFTCAHFEPVRCHTFVTESTFGLPIYRWSGAHDVMRSIGEWWRANQARGKCSVLFAGPLGKAQRILAELDSSIGPVFCHGAVENMNNVYRASGIRLPDTQYAGREWNRALVVGPPSARNSGWMKRFGSNSTALASGWMRIRGKRRHRSIDRGFILSDHADWPALQTAIAETGAERVIVTHGYREPLARWLQERGRESYALKIPA